MTEIAKAGGWSGRSSIQRYFSDRDFNVEWLSLPVARQFVKAFAGKGDPPITEAEVLALAGPGAGNTARAVPVIPLNIAADWQPEQATRWVSININVGERGFAIALTDKSMDPYYSVGDIIVIDPDSPARPGDLIVAKHNESAVFGEYVLMNTKPKEIAVRARNERWPYPPTTLKGEKDIIGKAVGLWRDL